MEKVIFFIKNTISYSKKTYMNNYKETSQIQISSALQNNIPIIKKIRKSNSETDLDKFQTTEETWGWFVDPKDVMR